MGDDTIAVCDQNESIILHRQEKKQVVMLAADGRYGSRCVYVCACVHACTVACTSIIFIMCLTLEVNIKNIIEERKDDAR